MVPFENPTFAGRAPGEILQVSADGRTLVIACGDASLKVTSFTRENIAVDPIAGDRVGEVERPAAMSAV